MPLVRPNAGRGNKLQRIGATWKPESVCAHRRQLDVGVVTVERTRDNRAVANGYSYRSIGIRRAAIQTSPIRQLVIREAHATRGRSAAAGRSSRKGAREIDVGHSSRKAVHVDRMEVAQHDHGQLLIGISDGIGGNSTIAARVLYRPDAAILSYGQPKTVCATAPTCENRLRLHRSDVGWRPDTNVCEVLFPQQQIADRRVHARVTNNAHRLRNVTEAG